MVGPVSPCPVVSPAAGNVASSTVQLTLGGSDPAMPALAAAIAATAAAADAAADAPIADSVAAAVAEVCKFSNENGAFDGVGRTVPEPGADAAGTEAGHLPKPKAAGIIPPSARIMFSL